MSVTIYVLRRTGVVRDWRRTAHPDSSRRNATPRKPVTSPATAIPYTPHNPLRITPKSWSDQRISLSRTLLSAVVRYCRVFRARSIIHSNINLDLAWRYGSVKIEYEKKIQRGNPVSCMSPKEKRKREIAVEYEKFYLFQHAGFLFFFIITKNKYNLW